MHLFLARLNDSISIDEMKSVGKGLDSIFDVRSELIQEPFNKSITQLDLKGFGEILYRQYLSEGTPFICVAYTREAMRDGKILGEALESQRVAFVRWSDRIDETVNRTAHELGHIFGIQGHCDKCLMIPYYKETDLNGKTVKDLFCDNCRRTIENSWSYPRVRSTSKQNITIKAATGSTANQDTLSKPKEVRDYSPKHTTTESFPDISTVNPQNPHEYIYRVLRYYKFGGR
jgi:hypothetical protein